ncbi:NAD-dependent epimerase/dehydratase family protein [uncultured Sphingomonas sp.]|uniref:NAD-dependent epimerase/dehydratase family protein n=1 Tax=uncultured Sphingomonas sp. TaxID=158754 RepID=UPI0025E82C70|nr:NAD-dependent epimerase/dehydratase family protein [uncultured Sphingomonas sp.]
MAENNLRVLLTGSAGFIGFHTASQLLQQGATVLGVDNFSDYYDVDLKEQRNNILENHPQFRVARVSIEDAGAVRDVWRDFAPDVVIHLAAQAGVRYSIDHPESYIGTNLIGTYNLLELARHHPVRHFLAASTSSVYGANRDMPFDERQRTQTPISLYAATKGATELMGHSYSHLYNIPMTFFRFFTVYGPWGRPDMALFKFAKAILADEPIDVYNNGEMVRDFTYVDDLAASIIRLSAAVPGNVPVEGDSLSPVAPFRVVNIGGGKPTPLMDYIGALEQALGKSANKNMLPMQQGDVPATEASPELLRRLTGEIPTTSVTEGVAAFVSWFRDHYRG